MENDQPTMSIMGDMTGVFALEGLAGACRQLQLHHQFRMVETLTKSWDVYHLSESISW